MILPIIATLSISLQINPFVLLVPVTLCATCAFALPASTPVNTIVFATGKIRVIDMIKVGIVLNLVTLTVVTLWGTFYGPFLFSSHNIGP